MRRSTGDQMPGDRMPGDRVPGDRIADRSATLTVSPGRAPGASVVTARGEFDLSNSGRLAEVLLDQLERGTRSVRLDLSAVTFFDATAISALATARLAYARDGAGLRLSGQRGIVARVLDLTGHHATMPRGGSPGGSQDSAASAGS